MLLRTLLDGGYLHGDVMTVTGKTLEQNLAGVLWRNDQNVIRPVADPLSPTGGVVGLWGSLAPDGAIVKVAGMSGHRAHRGPARVFDGEDACFAAVQRGDYSDGDVLVIRYEGPKGGPGMREIISIDADRGILDLEIDDVELLKRRSSWTPRETNYRSGAIWKFTQTVGPAHLGAVTHPGMRAESHVYADI